MRKLFGAFIICAMSAIGGFSQTNLLLNPSGNEGTVAWKVHGDARIESDGIKSHFVVRNGGGFVQIVQLDKAMVGKYGLLIGRGASDRINTNGSITGLPYLYGYFLTKQSTNGGTINQYLQGQSMLGGPRTSGEWIQMYGVFEIPAETVAVQFMLFQAERKDDPQNGSAARFDDVGFYVFDTKKEALNFAGGYLK